MNSFWLLSGAASQSLCQWLSLVVVARFGGLLDVANYAMATAILTPVFTLLNLQLREVLVSDYSLTIPISTYMYLRVISNSTALGAGIAFSYLLDASGGATLLFMVIGLSLAIDSFTDVLHGYLHQREDVFRISITMFVRGPVSLVSILLAYLLNGGVAEAFALVAFTRLIVFLALEIPLLWEIHKNSADTCSPGDGRVYIKHLIRAAVPFAMLAFLVSLRTAAPRYVSWFMVGEESLAILAIGSSIVAPLQMICQSANQAVFPRISRLLHEGDGGAVDKLERDLRNLCVLFGFAWAILAFLAGPLVVARVFNVADKGVVLIIVCMVVFTTANAAAKPSGLIARAQKQMTRLIRINVAAVLCSIALSSILAIPYGLAGVSGGMAISATLAYLIGIQLIRANQEPLIREIESRAA